MIKKTSQDSGHRINARAQIIAAIIAATGAIIVGWWQYKSKPVISEPSTPKHSKPKFVGRVTNVDTKALVSDAEVTLEIKDVPSATRTDSKGIFSFPIDEHTDEVIIRVQAAGYENFDQRIVPSSNTGIEDIRIRPLQKSTEPKPKNGSESSQNRSKVSSQAPANVRKSSAEQEISDSIRPSVPSLTKTMITVRLLIDNRLRNGNVFVDGKQVPSTPNAVIRKIEVIGFEYHVIMVATKTDTCKTSGYFNTDNQTISMNCN